MLNLFKFLSLGISGLSMAAALLLFMTDDGQGFLPHFGRVLAVGALGAGVLISWPLNLILLWRVPTAPPWLKPLLWVQTPAVLVMAAMAVSSGAESRREQGIYELRRAILEAIAADDPSGFDAAVAACDAACRSDAHSPHGWLRAAANKGSLKVATHLLAAHHIEDTTNHWDYRTERSCSGRTLSASQPLELAVLRNHRPMVDLLLPTATDYAKRRAMWMAAELDRLALMQHMNRAGVSLQWRGQIVDGNETLVVAAASGAAVRVARWLLEEHDFPAPANRLGPGPAPHPGARALRELLTYERNLDDPEAWSRARAFITVLIEHGGDIDERWSDAEVSALDEAVRVSDRQRADLLLSLGARVTLLKPERQDALRQLLAQPARDQREAQSIPDCIASGD
jgi:hypothetical protein